MGSGLTKEELEPGRYSNGDMESRKITVYHQNSRRDYTIKGTKVIIMSQGQLVGKVDEVKNGEGNRKRLKISVPHFDNTDLIKSYARTLIGRCMNPDEQIVKSLLMNLPKIWMVEERVTGVDLGMGKFQFHFDKEEDLVAVLEMQPYHFDYWMLALARWQPRMARTFPSEIPFWITVVGVPTEFWSTQTFQSIGDVVGETTDVDLHYGKIRVVIDGFKQICFETSVNFTGGEFYEGEEVLVALKYEKLFGCCQLCSSLCHHEDVCPTNPNPVKRREPKNDGTNRVDERARSYKGVVIHGGGGNQEGGKETRGYHCKGKGKMYEDSESKWIKKADAGHKRDYSNRSGPRMDEGNSRHRSSRWEQSRSMTQEARDRLIESTGAHEVHHVGSRWILKRRERFRVLRSSRYFPRRPMEK
ncbi:Uncharacterized protein Rs2_04633 [Raphanus sativus]|nr:Uncharacterized protein Rs2_04633 [Raphanus sativus]